MNRAESFMTLCMTREQNCTPDSCKVCGWIRQDTREYLIEHGDELIGETKAPPDGAKVELTVLIDQEAYQRYLDEGRSDIEIQHLIEKAITIDRSKAPIHDLDEVKVTKVY